MHLPNEPAICTDCGVGSATSIKGVLADHAEVEAAAALVAPATENQRNRLRPPLAPIACWCLHDGSFAFDSSFVHQEAAPQFKAFKSKLDDLTQHYGAAPLLSLFGHADTSGDDSYNKTLSSRRAEAIYAVFTRRTDLWERLYDQPFGGDRWGTAVVQMMLNALAEDGEHGELDPGPVDGVERPETKQAIKKYQAQNGLGADGICGAQTRAKLFADYMDYLCRGPDDTPYTLTVQDFLGQGAAGGKASYQGCSDFNPVLMFSQEQHAKYEQDSDKTERNAANEPNRRVLIFLFKPDTRIDPKSWPCPLASEGSSECKARFWSDWERRRQFGPMERRYEVTRDTFACRYYNRLAAESPCEKSKGVSLVDFYGRPTPHADRPEKPHMLIIPRASEVTLYWAVRGADAVQIQATTLEGDVTPVPLPNGGKNPDLQNVFKGQVGVTPGDAVNYILTASNDAEVTEYRPPVRVVCWFVPAPRVLPFDVIGIDVSQYQGVINWDRVADWTNPDGNPVSFAIARASVGMDEDTQFKANWSALHSKSILQAPYHFLTAGADPLQQMLHFYKVVDKYGGLFDGDLPPVIDFEWKPKTTTNAHARHNLNLALNWAEKFFGRTPIIYTGRWCWLPLIGDDPWFARYPLWVSDFDDHDDKNPASLDPAKPRYVPFRRNSPTPLPPFQSWRFWQIRVVPKGEVDGIHADLDFDVFNGDLAALHALTKLAPTSLVDIPESGLGAVSPARPSDSGRQSAKPTRLVVGGDFMGVVPDTGVKSGGEI